MIFVRGRIWISPSTRLPQTGGTLGLVDGIAFHDRTARTFTTLAAVQNCLIDVKSR